MPSSLSTSHIKFAFKSLGGIFIRCMFLSVLIIILCPQSQLITVHQNFSLATSPALITGELAATVLLRILSHDVSALATGVHNFPCSENQVWAGFSSVCLTIRCYALLTSFSILLHTLFLLSVASINQSEQKFASSLSLDFRFFKMIIAAIFEIKLKFLQNKCLKNHICGL